MILFQNIWETSIWFFCQEYRFFLNMYNRLWNHILVLVLITIFAFITITEQKNVRSQETWAVIDLCTCTSFSARGCTVSFKEANHYIDPNLSWHDYISFGLVLLQFWSTYIQKVAKMSNQVFRWIDSTKSIAWFNLCLISIMELILCAIKDFIADIERNLFIFNSSVHC